MPLLFDAAIKDLLDQRLDALEKHFDADVIFLFGELQHYLVKWVRDQIEKLKEDKRKRLVMVLGTPGGSAETAEKLVDLMRNHYDEVFFVVPDEAMSAGTILCMSGDRIFMDYSSSLGPIDPQVFNGTRYVPARGYVDQVEVFLDKAQKSTLTHAEAMIWQAQDLAFLSLCQQQIQLTVTLLKKWLVEYKFRDWKEHRTDPKKKGQPVTDDEKKLRAEEIAKALGNNQKWHSHGRRIGIETLKNDPELRLVIDDYSGDDELRKKIREYNDLFTDYLQKHGLLVHLHTRHLFQG